MLNPDKLSSVEVNKIKKEIGVEMVFVNGRLYKWKKRYPKMNNALETYTIYKKV